MRVLFWNINGVARDASQCKLKELFREFKLDVFCLAEPKVHFSVAFGNRLQLEGFSSHVIHNATTNSIANLWVCYLDSIRTSILNRSKQAISIKVDGVRISFVHASYVQVTRRRLWHQLNLQDDSIPWLVMGDFNCILRLGEKKGGLEPRTSAINEFSDWLDDNNLFEADCLGTKFTWTNSQPKRDPFHIQKMWFLHDDFLRMVFESWNMPAHGSIDFIFTYKLKRLKGVIKEWNLMVFGNVHSRLKQDQLRFETAALCSDEDPNDVTKLNAMKDDMAKLSETRLQHNTMLKQKFYEEKFNGHETVIDASLFNYDHVSIYLEQSLAMDRIPTPEEIKQAVFDLGADSAPGPDGFSGCFYRHCWDIIQEDLIKVVTYCWSTGHIPNGVNSSLIILLPKERGANSLRNFRPISLSDFFFKIFTKILATRLGSVLGNLVSEEHVAFMKGRNIHENISLASEMVNELHIKRKDGNIGLKFDISQAFDTVSWSFVLEVFRRYGFSEQWCSWILNILNSARISILLNGSPEGYFKINRGLRQGDPLSPLIFVLIEDVLSRNITKLFMEKKMSHMVTRGGISSTHLFFADDIMIFCKGNLKSLHNLVDVLGKYQTASGQTVCRQKSKIYYGGGYLSRRAYLAEYLGMSVATFPNRYLGVQIIPGTVRYHHISGVVEKIKAQLSGWKGFLLSFHNRIVLVKSVTASYSIHNMAIYKWPRKLIFQCERAIRNFIWTGDSNLWWKILTSKKKWVGFLRARLFGRNGCIKANGLKSSILPGIRKVYKIVESNTNVLIGDGRDTFLYYDAWALNMCIVDILDDYTLERSVLVSDILHDGRWEIPVEHLQRMTAAGLDVSQLPAPLDGADSRIWMPELKGNFTVNSARELIRQKFSKFPGASLLWRKEVHPTLAAQNWKFLRSACATYDIIQSRFQIHLANRCSLCGVADETLDHILFQCTFAGRAWNWIADVFDLIPNANLVVSCKEAKGKSAMIRDLWLIANLVIRSELWTMRNKAVFLRQHPNWSIFFKRVLKLIQDYVVRLNNAEYVIILDYFRVNHRRVKFLQPTECFWEPPEENEIQLCCDGEARGNPGVAGAGVVARNASCLVLGAMSIGLGVTTNYLAELYGIIVGMEWAVRWEVRRICIRSDSFSVVEALKNNNIPWFARQRWVAVCRHYDTVRFIHTYREANFSADVMAKRGCLLNEEEGLHYDARPLFLTSVEYPNIVEHDTSHDHVHGVHDNNSNNPLYNAISETEVVLSPNKFGVLSDELGLTDEAINAEVFREEENLEEHDTPEQAASGVKGTKWGNLDVEKRQARRILKPKDSQDASSSTELESNSGYDSEVNALGIKVKKCCSPGISKNGTA
ncbi:uncharacterized protein LOC113295544 [Papaver somniferum]|uniref:uncharacterized protein LOC113295544 n=1 Tax=Papaver somniferum TaxID=3469 RepID=UPI000E6F8AA4|nr:uncharacterized protein LOC113295544 [Papaver somniferum]